MNHHPRDPRSDYGSNNSDRSKRSRHESNARRHPSSNDNSNRRHYSQRHHDYRNNNNNNNRNRMPQFHMNMYVQRRDYYHPTFNQYGDASNNYIRDTNINLPTSYDANRGRGYGEEYNIPRYDSNYKDDYHYHNARSHHHENYSDSHTHQDNDYSRPYQHGKKDHAFSSPPQQSSSAHTNNFTEDDKKPRSYSVKSPNPDTNLKEEKCITETSLHETSLTNNVSPSKVDRQSSEKVSPNSTVLNTTNNVSSTIPPKKKRKRKMSERRKELHRQRARKHQEGLKRKKALEEEAKLSQISSSTSTSSKLEKVDQESNVGIKKMASKSVQSTNIKEATISLNSTHDKKDTSFKETNIVSSWNTAFNTQDDNCEWALERVTSLSKYLTNLCEISGISSGLPAKKNKLSRK